MMELQDMGRNDARHISEGGKLILSAYNLNYISLNNQLNRAKSEFGIRRAVSHRSLAGETRTFSEILDQEVEKVVLYYLRQQGELAAKAWALREEQIQDLHLHYVSADTIENMCQKYRALAQQVLDLLEYLDENILRLRKILEKHDSLFDQKMGSVYFDTRLGKSAKNSQLLQLYHQEGIRAIMGTLRRGFEELHGAKAALLCNSRMSSSASTTLLSRDLGNHHRTLSRGNLWQRRGSVSDSIGFNLNTFGNRVSGGGSSANVRSSERNRSTGSLFALLRGRSSNNFHGPLDTGTSSIGFEPSDGQLRRTISELEPILQQVTDAANRVMTEQQQSTSEFLVSTSKMALEISMGDLHRTDSDSDLTQVKTQLKHEAARRGLNINLLITFIYLANQYVVAPTSGEYAHLLGLTPAMSGVIIGLTPAAALLSSLLYSWWSNYSFKQPLLFCIVCGIVGNLIYALALQCSASWMLLLGRLLTGFGGTRVVTRRYIADHVPAKERIVASTRFVTAGAMGLAWGPLISSLVSRSNAQFDFRLQQLLIARYQSVTAPGWIMAAMWIGALFLVLVYFTEPDKKDMRAHQMKADEINRRSNSALRKMELLAIAAEQANQQPNQPPHSNSSSSKKVATTDFNFTTTATASNKQYPFNSIMNYLNGSSKVAISGAEETADSIPLGSSLRNSGNAKYGSLPAEEIMFVESGNELFAMEEANLINCSQSVDVGDRADLQSDLERSIAVVSMGDRKPPKRPVDESVTTGGAAASLVNYNPIFPEGSGITNSAHGSEKSVPSRSSSSVGSDHNGWLGDAASAGVTNSRAPVINGSDPSIDLHDHTNNSIGASVGNFEWSATTSYTAPLAPLPLSNRGIGSYQRTLVNAKGISSIGGEEEEDERPPSCYEYITLEVGLILFLYFINKIGQELSVSSIPLLTMSIFHWTNEDSGYYMAVMGAMVLPMTVLVNFVVKEIDERDMVLRLFYVCIASSLFVCHLDILGPYTLLQYVAGSATLFAALNSMEGIIMALLAKIISPELAKGTFNSGLLATESGTLGRVAGDLMITVFGVAQEPSSLVNKLFLPVAGMLLLSTLLVHYYYHRLY